MAAYVTLSQFLSSVIGDGRIYFQFQQGSKQGGDGCCVLLIAVSVGTAYRSAWVCHRRAKQAQLPRPSIRVSTVLLFFCLRGHRQVLVCVLQRLLTRWSAKNNRDCNLLVLIVFLKARQPRESPLQSSVPLIRKETIDRSSAVRVFDEW